MSRRLTAKDWIDFALTTLAQEGSDALKADILARRLGVSRGSFYWHFAGLDAFHARVIAHWRHIATEAIIAFIERFDSRERRLDALLRRAFGTDARLEVRMRGWADRNAAAARALADVDRRRTTYIERLLVEAGAAPAEAETRAQILYWTYLGAAFGHSKLGGERLERVVAELKTIGLAGGVRRARRGGQRPPASRRPRG